ncbi:glycosyltransferase family 4 protein [PVC group bacterium]|nr:glycosyltransferase family 4 protein [PVC group bacterium]
MRIAFYISLYDGGIKRRITDMVSVLSKNHTVKCYVLVHSGYEYKDLDEMGIDIIRYHLNNPCVSKSYFINSLLSYINVLKSWRLQKSIAKEIDRESHDCVMINPCSLSWTPIVIKYIKTKNTYYMDGVYRRFYEPLIDASEIYPMRDTSYIFNKSMQLGNFICHRFLFLGLKWLDRYLLSFSENNMCYTEYERKWIKSAYGIEAEVIYPGINIMTFAPDEKNCTKDHTVLAVGGITWAKGYRFLITACSQIDKCVRPKLVLILVSLRTSRSRYISDLKRYAKKMDVNLEIRTNYHNDNEMVEIYRRSKLTLCASIGETFGFTVLESLACQTPVVTTCPGGPAEIVRDGGTGRVVPRETKTFAEAIESYLTDDDLRKRHGHQARADVLDRWDWRKRIIPLEKFLLKIISMNPS